MQQGQSFEITGKNQAGTWWQFSFNGQPAWISGEMVSANAAAQNVQVVESIPTAPVQPTAAPPPGQPVPRPCGQPRPTPAGSHLLSRRPRIPQCRCSEFQRRDILGPSGPDGWRSHQRLQDEDQLAFG